VAGLLAPLSPLSAKELKKPLLVGDVCVPFPTQDGFPFLEGPEVGIFFPPAPSRLLEFSPSKYLMVFSSSLVMEGL